jgi:hypothetical protein
VLGRRPVTAAAALTALAALTACTDDRPAQTSPPPVAEVRRSAELAHDPDVRREVQDAVAALVGADTATYKLVLQSGDSAVVETGRYSLSTRAWDLEREFFSHGRSTIYRLRSDGRDRWMSIERTRADQRQQSCWASIRDLSELSNVEVPQRSPAPSTIIAAAPVVGRESTAEGIVGTTSLAAAAGLFGNTLRMSGALDPKSEATVPVDLTLDDGVLTAMSIRLPDLVEALNEAGVNLDGDELTLSRTITVRFDDIGEPVSVDAPAADSVMSGLSAADIDQQLMDCAAS